ncbi:MAG: hypothetical protein AAGA75_08895 [Cyanobacteria bacterium P01_E01_bin.6]
MGLYEFGLEVLSFFGLVDQHLYHSKNARGFIENVKDDRNFMHYLEQRNPLLYQHLHHVVLPIAPRIKVKEAELKVKKEAYLEASAFFEEAMSHLYAQQPEIAYDINGGLIAVETLARKGHRIEETMRRRKLFDEAAKRKKKLVGLISAGLGGLNLISVIKILGIDIERFTLETLVLGSIGLSFSASSMIALHLGLVDFISSTRDFQVETGKPISKNLFPSGWKDKALWISVGVVVIDALFSSVGLIQGLPPMHKDDAFWKLAILCVSGFGSVINVLLAWGIALDRLNFDIQLRAEGVWQKENVIDLQPFIQQANTGKEQLTLLRADISKLERDILTIKAEAHVAYRDWYRDVCIMQTTDERDRRNLPKHYRETLPPYDIKYKMNGHQPKELPSETQNIEHHSDAS